MATGRRRQNPPVTTAAQEESRKDPSTGEANRGQGQNHDLSRLVWKYFEEEIREALAEVIESLQAGNSNRHSR